MTGWGEIQHRSCDVPSCMSVEVGWSYNIYHVTGWGGEIQHRSCDVLSCMSVEVGWSYNIYHVTGWGGGRDTTQIM